MMILACILGYATLAASFYLYITRTAQIEPEAESQSLGATPTLTMLQSGSADGEAIRKVA